MKKSSNKKTVFKHLDIVLMVVCIATLISVFIPSRIDIFFTSVTVEAAIAEKSQTGDNKNTTKQQQQIDKAENSVKYLEDHQATKNIQSAQSAVDKVVDAEQKAKFQHRIELVKNAIAQKANTKRIKAEAEQAVKYLEDNQLKENIPNAQTAVDKVANPEQKGKFQHRIELVKNAISQKVESVVKKLEDYQFIGNVQPAEAALETLSDANQKAAYQHRIELVKNAIAQREEAERQVLAERQANRKVYVTQYGTNDVYWYSMENMPSTTRFDKVVSMTEAEALAQGKHHSQRE